MKQIIHMCIDIAGALSYYGKKSMRGLIKEDNGAEWTDKMVKDYFKKCLAEGKKVLPISDANCKGFDYQTGCPGHPVKD